MNDCSAGPTAPLKNRAPLVPCSTRVGSAFRMRRHRARIERARSWASILRSGLEQMLTFEVAPFAVVEPGGHRIGVHLAQSALGYRAEYFSSERLAAMASLTR